jgi:two-component system, OmpR family, sensor kinase
VIWRSVRVRLAAWHTGVLALVLVAFTAVTFGFLRRLTQDRIDRSLQDAVSSFHHAVVAELRAARSPEGAAEMAAREFRFSGRRVLVYGQHHLLVAVSDSARDALTRAISAVDDADDSPIHPMFATLTPGRSAFATVRTGGEEVRAYATRVDVAGRPFTIVAVQLDLTEGAILDAFVQAAAVAIPLALALAGLGGYLLARRSFAAVVRMGREASQISSESLSARLHVRNTGDELDELATVFNDMLARLERSFAQQRQFMADASHELRTPIASLRAEATVALSQRRAPAEYEASLARVRDEARRLSRIVDDLFTLARLDAADRELRRDDFFLEEVVLESVDRVRPLAAARGVALEFHPAAEARCVGDAALVGRVVTNLLDNALKYTPAGGAVHVELEAADARHVVRVIDSGIGIPEGARSRVFDRFFRADSARTRSETALDGAGLGLSIAREIVRAHGGTLDLVASRPGRTEFALALPAAAGAPAVAEPLGAR